jgi:hypothetical protein
MIVRSEGDTLLLITQPDHAKLSGHLMEGWVANGLIDHQWRTEILLATREHDNGWREVDAAPEVNRETGLPYDFMTSPDGVKQPIWPRGVACLAPRSPLAAAFVAQHALTIHSRNRGSEGWRGFFSDMEETVDRLMETAGLERGPSRGSFTAAYRFVFLGDLLSLVFCNGWQDPVRAKDYTVELRNGTLAVQPDPFGGRRLRFVVPGRRIPRRFYNTSDELRRELDRAPTFVLEGEATGS